MNRIREMRNINKLTQQKLADRINKTKSVVSRYEKGTLEFDISTLKLLCDIFDCSADYLLGRSDQRRPDISAEEAELLAAYRRADADTKAMIALALKRWTQDQKAENAAS